MRLAPQPIHANPGLAFLFEVVKGKQLIAAQHRQAAVEAGTGVDVQDIAEYAHRFNHGMAAHDKVDALDGLGGAAADA